VIFSASHIVARVTPEEYVEEVLTLVESVPPGRVISYGAIADQLAERSGRASARRIGTIMARYGGGVPWHRVVAASGRLPPGNEREAGARLLAEGVTLRSGRVPMARYAWSPLDQAAEPEPARERLSGRGLPADRD
jgi:alkylated DNA nucleotide flippase Atl1